MQKIGLIAGNGRLPLIWTENAKKADVKVIAIAFKSETEKKLQDYADKIYWLSLGQLNKLVEILKTEEITQAVMIGQIRTIPFLFKARFSKDPSLKKILKEVKDRRGNSLLAAFAKYLEENGISLLDSRTFISDYLPQKGNLTSVEIDEKTRKDIDFGFRIAKRIAELDIGQTVIIKDLAVIAVEAMEGTNQAILRGMKLGGKGVVVVKVSGPNHDMRFDIPVVGPKTMRCLKKAGARVLAVEAQRSLIVDKENTLKQAVKNKIAVVAL